MRGRIIVSLAGLVVLAAVSLGSYDLGLRAGLAGVPGTASASILPRPEASAPTAIAERFEPFWETWRLVESEFYQKDAVDYEKMIYGAIRGMLASLGDQHTAFETPSHTRYSAEDMHGAFDGIGVTVALQNNRIIVVSPLDDSPALKAGLRGGDVIVKIGDRDTAGLTLAEAVALIRGRRGTVVHLIVERQGEPAALAFDVRRAEIKMALIKAQMMDDVAYVKVPQFAEPTADQLRDKLGQLVAQKPRAVILDLRNNRGGLLTSAVDVASQFMARGVVLHEERDGSTQTFRRRGDAVAAHLPLVVLVNNGSASAAEIVAGALQDNGRAVLVGERSHGKDTVQNVHVLSDGSSVRISVARWLTPKKQPIAAKGLTPDIEVVPSADDLQAGRDPQLERALTQARAGA